MNSYDSYLKREYEQLIMGRLSVASLLLIYTEWCTEVCEVEKGMVHTEDMLLLLNVALILGKRKVTTILS
jgi:hypothetical protein